MKIDLLFFSFWLWAFELVYASKKRDFFELQGHQPFSYVVDNLIKRSKKVAKTSAPRPRAKPILQSFIDLDQAVIIRYLNIFPESSFISSPIFEKLFELKNYQPIYKVLEIARSVELIRDLFWVSIVEGRTALAKHLLQNYNNNLKKNHMKYISLAIKHNRMKILRFMSKSGFRIATSSYGDQSYFLHKAAKSNNLSLLKILLHFAGAKVNMKNSFGRTALFFAKSVEMASYLLENGANLNIMDLEGCTADEHALRGLRGPVYRRMLSFEARLEQFYDCFQMCKIDHVTISVNRESILHDSFMQLMFLKVWKADTIDVKVKFVGEKGIDAGGPRQEWYSLVIERFFSSPKKEMEEAQQEVVVDTTINFETDLPQSTIENYNGVIDMTVGDLSFVETSGSLPDYIPLLRYSESDELDESGHYAYVSQNWDELKDELEDYESEEDELEDKSEEDELEDKSEEDELEDESEEDDSSSNFSIGTEFDSDLEDELSSSSDDENFMSPDGSQMEYLESDFNSPIFELVDKESTYYRFSNSFKGPIKLYKFAGVVLAKALKRRIPTSALLAPSILKLLFGKQLVFEDLEEEDKAYYNSLKIVREPDCDFDFLQLSFFTNPMREVNSTNYEEFLQDAVEYLLIEPYRAKMEYFAKGFFSVYQKAKLSTFFTWEELGDAITGEHVVDFDDLTEKIHFCNRYWRSNKALFFSALRALSNEELLDLIKYVTGCNGLPFGGVKNFSFKIKIEDRGSDYPYASTCFKTLQLPTSISTEAALITLFKGLPQNDKHFHDQFD